MQLCRLCLTQGHLGKVVHAGEIKLELYSPNPAPRRVNLQRVVLSLIYGEAPNGLPALLLTCLLLWLLVSASVLAHGDFSLLLLNLSMNLSFLLLCVFYFFMFGVERKVFSLTGSYKLYCYFKIM